MKRFFSPTALLTVLMLLIIFSLSVGADMGPKPSVVIEFENMGDQPCYGTLLSKNPSTGPYSVWSGDAADAIHNGNEYYEYTDITEDLWRAFVEYEDTDLPRSFILIENEDGDASPFSLRLSRISPAGLRERAQISLASLGEEK